MENPLDNLCVWNITSFIKKDNIMEQAKKIAENIKRCYSQGKTKVVLEEEINSENMKYLIKNGFKIHKSVLIDGSGVEIKTKYVVSWMEKDYAKTHEELVAYYGANPEKSSWKNLM